MAQQGRYIYQRHGAPLLSWAGGPPSQTRAADAKSLGDFSSPPGNRMGLPRPGSPEFLAAYDAIPSSNPPIRQRGVGNYIKLGDATTPPAPTAADYFNEYKRSVGSAAAAFHGIKRNNGSVLMGLVWGVIGYIAPVTTNVVAVAQGFSKPKSCP
jgi:hypothetical protein